MVRRVGAAELIRDSRLAAGLTQTQLAERAGTSQAAVARYEKGHATPALVTIERLLDVCGQRLVLSTEARPRQPKTVDEIRKLRRPLLELARRHGATGLRLFGSVARGDDRSDSDVDLLVDLEPGRTLLDLAAIRREAAELLGRDVDVTTMEMLREPVRREAARDAVPV
jgi:predicted nucleotidyltransferase/DNA-binding XRE family transcriptional regulator